MKRSTRHPFTIIELLVACQPTAKGRADAKLGNLQELHDAPRRRPTRSSFTIIELLVVTFIIGIVLTLAIAPFDKLVTVAGVDGAANMISTQIRACRQHAVSKRTRVALILYSEGNAQALRTAELDKSGDFSQWTANSSWTYLPTAAIVEEITPAGSRETVDFTDPADLNPISSTARTYQAIVFKPTGKLDHGSSPTLKISDAIYSGTGLTNGGDGSNYNARGDGNNYVNLTVNRFTGQVTVSGP